MLRCAVCDLSVNSSLQMSQHMAGEKHKKKLLASGVSQNPVPAAKLNGPLGQQKTPCGGFINFVRSGVTSADSGIDLGGLDGPNAEPLSPVPLNNTGPVQNSVSGNGLLGVKRSNPAPPSGGCAGPHGGVGLEGGGPVDWAVVDNALGRLPTKRKPESLTCDVCKMSFNSPSQADAHFTGSKHAKRLRMVTPDDGQKDFVAVTGVETIKGGGLLFCSFCNIQVNSPPQMDAHRSGAKHKARVEVCRQMAFGSAAKMSQALVTSSAKPLAPPHTPVMAPMPVSSHAPCPRPVHGANRKPESVSAMPKRADQQMGQF